MVLAKQRCVAHLISKERHISFEFYFSFLSSFSFSFSFETGDNTRSKFVWIEKITERERERGSLVGGQEFCFDLRWELFLFQLQVNKNNNIFNVYSWLRYCHEMPPRLRINIGINMLSLSLSLLKKNTILMQLLWFF